MVDPDGGADRAPSADKVTGCQGDRVTERSIGFLPGTFEHEYVELPDGHKVVQRPSYRLRFGGQAVAVQAGHFGNVDPRRWLPHEGTMQEVMRLARTHGYTHFRNPGEHAWSDIDVFLDLGANPYVLPEARSILERGEADWDGEIVDDGEMVLLVFNAMADGPRFQPIAHLATAERIQRYIDANLVEQPAVPVEWLPGKASVTQLIRQARLAGFTHYSNVDDPDWYVLSEPPADFEKMLAAPLTILNKMHVASPGGRFHWDAEAVGDELRLSYLDGQGQWRAVASLWIRHGRVADPRDP